MAAAQRAIATRGLGALRLKDIAKEAGVTGPAVSYYYPDIDELLVDVYRRHIQELMERWPAAIAGLNHPWDQLTALVGEDIPDGPEDVDAIIMYQFSGEPRFAKTYGAMSSALHTSQTGMYRSIIDTGIGLELFFPELNSQTLSRAFIALTDAYGLQVVVAEPGISRSSAIEEVLRVAASLLRFHPE